jgi:glycerate 2-kinase
VDGTKRAAAGHGDGPSRLAGPSGGPPNGTAVDVGASQVKVVVAPDGYGDPLGAREVAQAIADGWRTERDADELHLVPLSDGGEGLLDAIATAEDTWLTTEVVGPHGHPVEAALLLRPDGSAVIESAQACGLARLAPDRRTPMPATTWGVGELLDAAREAGARRLLVGLGGAVTVDGGAGALSGLGFRLRVEDGSGLKIGGGELPRVRSAAHGWAADWHGIEVVLLADVTTTLADAARAVGPPQAALTAAELEVLARGLETWADVAERDLAGGRRVRDLPGSGAAGGLGFGLACALEAAFVPGAATVADLQGLPAMLDGADLVVTGAGRVDASAPEGEVVGYVREVAAARGVGVAVIAGAFEDDVRAALDTGLAGAAAPERPGPDPALEVAAAAARLAARC